MFQYLAAALSLASAACAAVTTVTVGQGGFVFAPNTITAAEGDVVNFKFTGSPGNHTVSQSTFADPCSQLSGGFDSGFVPVASGFSGTPTEWNLTVTNASAPIWFYCKQTSPAPHCISGMVGYVFYPSYLRAINPPSSGNTLANFVSAAKALSSFPTQTAGSLTGVGASASASPAVPGSAAASGTSSGASASGTAPSSTSPSASSTQSGAAFKTSTGSLWALLAGVLGIVIA
ncbi:hypothetical protein JB92DRAFT_3084004 [Gautieria morchelliformis]|nr:hypothetical protein JB92DRAFT_3084004 [Gautieria morchelliformis]